MYELHIKDLIFMKKQKSLLKLKKFTIASIHTPYTILGAGESVNCQANTTNSTSKSSSTNDPLSQARGCAAGNNGGSKN